MSNDGGASYGPNEPTSFGLQPPQQPGVPGQSGQAGQNGGVHPGNPYAQQSPQQPQQPQQSPTQQAQHQSPQAQAQPQQHQQSQQPAPPTPPPSPYAQPTQVVPNQQGGEAEPGAGRLVAGRYRLLSKLGHGGMGTVWRAKDETVDREVAVKEPRLPDHLPERERANAFERMRREARAAARLDHPSVVNVHDVAVEDGQPWIVMELVRGRSLGAALQEGTLGAREAARIGRDVLNALDAAHQAGILHRDVKPDNVMLGNHDRVVLTDFGIAQIEGETNLTDTGGFVGSPEFIAPERVLGQRPGPASDLWSLGVVLYAATEGVSPFRRSNTPATLQSVLNATPAAPASASGPLADAINGLLAKDPAQRPNAARVRALLEEAAKPPQPAPTQFVPTGDAGSGRKGVVLGRKTLIGIGAAVVAAAVAAYLVVADPFAGSLPSDWETKEAKGLGATLAVPAGYQVSKPEADDEKHWVQYTDQSGSVWVLLSLVKKSEDDSGEIAGTAAAEMYDDDADFKQSGKYDLGMASDPAPKTDPESDTEYRGKKAAENTVVYSSTDSQNPRPRELKAFYYKTGSGDMYKLVISYPGKGDFTERGREVASTAIDNLDIDDV
ncbi:serine/threonine protein kinase [Streptomyces kanamyceticus]|uniref:non-specific serine/threonine protein kinase n=1 Tax=Streptomyces kanamyceticus TaxID=1967 RepID=A0A5J6GEN1_STRKN|nr:serine/threonine-protein kinase [Streptomyces kanamyceticus]QEU92371.1 serine/threonine protein kinase [Streptomyces kanamyceticus]